MNSESTLFDLEERKLIFCAQHKTNYWSSRSEYSGRAIYRLAILIYIGGDLHISLIDLKW